MTKLVWKDREIVREIVVYLKCSKDIETKNESVYLRDIASIECEDDKVSARCKRIKIYQFMNTGPDRTVISVTKVIQLICRECPGVLVQSVGETDVLLEKVKEDAYKGWKQWIKVAGVCLVSSLGTAFTLIAYNNDIAISDIFDRLYQVVLNEKAPGVHVLEIAYSLGLAVGIIVFFNHIGGRRITKDPTPIEVSMRNYERDVNQALIETADREGVEEDV